MQNQDLWQGTKKIKPNPHEVVGDSKQVAFSVYGERRQTLPEACGFLIYKEE